MKQPGILRHLDDHRRIHIPKEFCEILNIATGDSVELSVHGRCIQLRKHQKGCSFCNNQYVKLIEHNGLKVCQACARHLGHEADKLD